MKAFINIEPLRLGELTLWLAPVHPDPAVRLVSRVSAYPEGLGDLPGFAQGGHIPGGTGRVVLKTVKRAGNPVAVDLTQAQRCADVRADIAHHVHLAGGIPPDDQFFAHPGDAERFAGFDFA